MDQNHLRVGPNKILPLVMELSQAGTFLQVFFRDGKAKGPPMASPSFRVASPTSRTAPPSETRFSPGPEARACADQADFAGLTPLMAAAINADAKVVRWLLDAKADKEKAPVF